MSLPWGIGTLLVISAMHLTLSELFNAGDTTSVEENKNRLVDFAEFVMRTPSPPEEAEEDEEFKESLVDRIENLSEIKSKDYTRYVYFCENVVSPF